MASSPSTVIACAALALSGCAVGVLLGRWTAAPSPAGERETYSQLPSADLRPAMAEVQRTSEAILLTLQARGNAPQPIPSQRESATLPPADLDRLTTAIETLNALLQSGGGRTGGHSPSIEKWKGPGYPSIGALWQRAHEIARSGDENWGEKFDSEMRRAHLAWTREDLFERYGAPTVLNAKDRGLEFGYRRTLEADATESIVFQVADDLVVYVYFDG